MPKKAIIVLIVVLVAVAIAAIAMTRTAPPAVAPTDPQVVTTTEQQAQQVTTSVATASGVVAWEFQVEGEDPVTLAPHTRVYLINGRDRHDLGVYDGSCFVKETGLLANETDAVLCWFAGGGNEIGIFQENGQRVVKVGVVDEGSPEDGGGFRGDFTTKLIL